MTRSQLAINCPLPLLQRLRAEAQRQQTTATALVLAWLEAGLDGHLEAPRPASSSELEQRLAAVEQRLDAIAAQPLAHHGEPEGEDVPMAPPKRGRADESRDYNVRSTTESKGDNITLTQLGYHSNLVPESPTSQSTTEKEAEQFSKWNSSSTLPSSVEVLTTAELADRLGVKRNTLNERLRRAGGAALGFELDGWRCIGKARPARGGPEQWQWQAV